MKMKTKVKVKVMKKVTVIHQTKQLRIVLDQGSVYRGLHHEDIVIHQGSREPPMEIVINTDRMSL
jgi:hypothetical protein